jgi:hypothetical protein
LKIIDLATSIFPPDSETHQKPFRFVLFSLVSFRLFFPLSTGRSSCEGRRRTNTFGFCSNYRDRVAFSCQKRIASAAGCLPSLEKASSCVLFREATKVARIARSMCVCDNYVCHSGPILRVAHKGQRKFMISYRPRGKLPP